MLRFLRTIRQSLLAQGRITRYLTYAIGEIVLVVIGILIALQVNNQNELRKLHAREQTYLAALKEEFAFNKAQLEKVMRSNARFGDAAQEILKHTGPEAPGLSEEEFIGLFLRMINSEVQYRPSNGVLQEILSSGKLDIFRNAELRESLSSWDGILYTVRFQEGELNATRLELINIVNEQGNVRQLFHVTGNNKLQLSPSRFATQNRELLRSVVFENRTTAFLATSRFTNAYYYPDVEKAINSILGAIENELSR